MLSSPLRIGCGRWTYWAFMHDVDPFHSRGQKVNSRKACCCDNEHLLGTMLTKHQNSHHTKFEILLKSEWCRSPYVCTVLWMALFSHRSNHTVILGHTYTQPCALSDCSIRMHALFWLHAHITSVGLHRFEHWNVQNRSHTYFTND